MFGNKIRPGAFVVNDDTGDLLQCTGSKGVYEFYLRKKSSISSFSEPNSEKITLTKEQVDQGAFRRVEASEFFKLFFGPDK